MCLLWLNVSWQCRNNCYKQERKLDSSGDNVYITRFMIWTWICWSRHTDQKDRVKERLEGSDSRLAINKNPLQQLLIKHFWFGHTLRTSSNSFKHMNRRIFGLVIHCELHQIILNTWIDDHPALKFHLCLVTIR